MAFVDLNNLPAFGLAVQKSMPELSKLTTTQIAQNETQLLSSLLRNSSDIRDLYNQTFGITEPVELQSVFEWVVPHEDVRSMQVILFSVLTAAALLMVVIRLWTSAVYRRRISAADWSIGAAMFLTIGYVVISILALEHAGNGTHVWDLTLRQYKLNITMAYTLQIYAMITLVPIKMAFLFFYQTLSDSRLWRTLIGIIGMVVALSAIAFVVLTGVIYSPNAWYRQLANRAPNEISPLQGSGIASLATDLAIYLLPIFILVKFDFSRVEKAIIFFIFVAGGAALISAAMRMVSMLEYAKGHDFSWTSNTHILWTIVKLDVALICVSIPGIRPMVVSRWPQLFVPKPEIDSDESGDDVPIDVNFKAEDFRRHSATSVGRKDSFQIPTVTTRVESRGGSDMRDLERNDGILVTYTYDVGSTVELNNFESSTRGLPPRGAVYNNTPEQAPPVAPYDIGHAYGEPPAYDGTGPSRLPSDEKRLPPGTPGMAV